MQGWCKGRFGRYNGVVIGIILGLKSGYLAAESGTVRLVDKNAEESSRLLVEVWFDIILDIENESKSCRREKIGLSPPKVSSARHTKMNMAFRPSSYFL